MIVKVKKLHSNAVVPKYAKEGDAGLDLVATSMERNSNLIVYGTGLAFEIPKGYVGLLFPRSSISKKQLYMTNSVGVIDSGYRGEVKLAFKTQLDKFDLVPDKYEIGDRVGQIIIMPYPHIELEETDSLSNSERGEGGFGSSGN